MDSSGHVCVNVVISSRGILFSAYLILGIFLPFYTKYTSAATNASSAPIAIETSRKDTAVKK